MVPVRLGVIGCGVIGQQHLEAATDSPLTEVEAVADLRGEAARDAARKFGIKAAYDNAEALLNDPNVEAVVLAMPACSRTALAIQAFARNKHVLTEKPVAMNAREVEQMIRARGEKLVAACCSSRMRFFESAEAATKFVGSGALGDLRVIRCRALMSVNQPLDTSPPSWRLDKSLNGGGILANWGCYDLDYVLGITGWKLKPNLVLAKTWAIPDQFKPYVDAGSDAETHFVALIFCEGGCVIVFERAEYISARPEGVWEVVGNNGTLHLAMAADPARIVFDTLISVEDGLISKTIWQGRETNGSAVTRIGPIEDFAVAVRERRSPKTGLEQALVVQKITDAILASAGSGQSAMID